MNRVDRRSSCSDRRIEDIGPPSGWKDRRRHVERRIPETLEIEVTEAEWVLFFESRTTAEAPPETTAQQEVAANIFDRARS